MVDEDKFCVQLMLRISIQSKPVVTLTTSTRLCSSGDSVRRTIVGPPGPQGPKGQKGERGEPGYSQSYVQTQSYQQGNARYGSQQRDIDVSKLTETLDYSSVAMKVTDYIKSEWATVAAVVCPASYHLCGGTGTSKYSV